MKKKLLEIFHKFKPGDAVDSDTVALFAQCIDPYLEFKGKRGGKTIKIDVKKDVYGNSIFFYMNESGEGCTASIYKAVKYYKTGKVVDNKLVKLKDACRYAISDQIISFRKRQNGRCWICLNKNACEVDHYPTSFSTIFNDFFKSNTNIELYEAGNYHRWKMSADKELNWQSYHAKRARYRHLCTRCHSNYSKSQILSEKV